MLRLTPNATKGTGFKKLEPKKSPAFAGLGWWEGELLSSLCEYLHRLVDNVRQLRLLDNIHLRRLIE